MEARDSGSKIRPLPVDDLDTDAPQQHPIEGKRRWVPLAVIAAGALAFAVLTAGLGPAEPDPVAGPTTEPPEIATEPTTPPITITLPAPTLSLAELLPFADAGIQLVSYDSTTARIGQWDPGSSNPVYNARVTNAISGSVQYNSDGSLVAVGTRAGRSGIIIDISPGGNPSYIRGATSGSWHQTLPDLYAWTEATVDEQTLLRVASFPAADAITPDTTIELTLPGTHTLEAWGEWGFATQSGTETVVFDGAGVEQRRAQGRFYGATFDGTLLLRDSEDGSVPCLFYPNGLLIDLPGLDIGPSEYRITGDGDWVFAVTPQADGHTSILARAVNSRSTRLTSIEGAANIVGFMADDRAIVLQEVASGDLVFKDWSSGAEFRAPMDSIVVAVYVNEPEITGI